MFDSEENSIDCSRRRHHHQQNRQHSHIIYEVIISSDFIFSFIYLTL